MADKDWAIGVFDSGVGGVSVLRDMARLLPGERFLYYGDNQNAPYGVRPEEEIRALSLAAAQRLLREPLKALVVACNTATSAAIADLRARLTIPVVGMEPALKPAAQMAREGQVLVLATPATLRQRKFHHLYELYGQRALVCPCEGLMEFAEAGELGGQRLDGYLRDAFAPYRGMLLDALVLGCTHYVFLKRAIGQALPGVPLIDGNLGTARRLAHLLSEAGLERVQGQGEVRFITSGDERVFIPRMEMLFRLPADL